VFIVASKLSADEAISARNPLDAALLTWTAMQE
jgi:hypothetical protein